MWTAIAKYLDTKTFSEQKVAKVLEVSKSNIKSQLMFGKELTPRSCYLLIVPSVGGREQTTPKSGHLIHEHRVPTI